MQYSCITEAMQYPCSTHVLLTLSLDYKSKKRLCCHQSPGKVFTVTDWKEISLWVCVPDGKQDVLQPVDLPDCLKETLETWKFLSTHPNSSVFGIKLKINNKKLSKKKSFPEAASGSQLTARAATDLTISWLEVKCYVIFQALLSCSLSSTEPPEYQQLCCNSGIKFFEIHTPMASHYRSLNSVVMNCLRTLPAQLF